MNKFKVGDKVALKNSPYVEFGIIDNIVFNYYLIDIGNDCYKMVEEDDIVLIEKATDLSNDEIYDMLKPKMDNVLQWHSVQSIKNDPFPPQIFERIGNSVNVRYQQYCTELDIKHAIALAYRSGYLRAKKGRPFKIGGDKD